MAAIGIHIAHVNFLPVSIHTGKVVDKTDPTTTIGAVLQTEHRHVVLPDAALPNTAGYPTVEQYLTLEAAGGFFLRYMDQNKIITYNA